MPKTGFEHSKASIVCGTLVLQNTIAPASLRTSTTAESFSLGRFEYLRQKESQLPLRGYVLPGRVLATGSEGYRAWKSESVPHETSAVIYAFIVQVIFDSGRHTQQELVIQFLLRGSLDEVIQSVCFV